MKCPYCDKSIWIKMEVRDNGMHVVMPLTVDEVADKVLKQKEVEKNGIGSEK